MEGRRAQRKLVPEEKDQVRNAIRAALAGLLLSVPGVVVAYILGHVVYAVTR